MASAMRPLVLLLLAGACGDEPGAGQPGSGSSSSGGNVSTSSGSQPGDTSSDAAEGSEGSSSSGGSSSTTGGDFPACSQPDFEPQQTTTICPGPGPAAVLSELWSALDERYAVFDARHPRLDWAAAGRATCDTLPDDPGDDLLFDTLLQLLRALDDGHIQLGSAPLDRDEDAWVTRYPYEDEVDGLEGNVEDNYADAPLRYAAEDEFAWGTIGSIGYLSITSLDDLSPSGDEDDDVDAAAEAMAQAIAELGQLDGIIVDVRANGGGWDLVSLEVSTWFAGPATLAWSEARRDGPAHDDFSPFEDVLLDPARPTAFDGPVILLTSGATFSAAETFALALRERDDVTLMGEDTSGHFSDLLETCLSNGWSLTLSGERYRAADGVLYEGLGVPVDIPIPFDPSALARGQDPMLEQALQTLTP